MPRYQVLPTDANGVSIAVGDRITFKPTALGRVLPVIAVGDDLVCYRIDREHIGSWTASSCVVKGDSLEEIDADVDELRYFFENENEADDIVPKVKELLRRQRYALRTCETAGATNE